MRLATKYETIFFHPRDADANRYFGYITTPLSTRKKWIISDLAKQLKSDGNWLLLDRLWLFANENQQSAQVSLVNPSSTQITEVNSPAWTANQGYTGNGTTSYLNLNFNPNTQGINFTLNNGGVSLYTRTNVVEDRTCFGNLVTSPTALAMSSEYTDLFTGRINANTNLSYSNTNAIGMYSLVRTANNSTTGYKNGISQASDTVLSVSIPNNNLFLCCYNNNGTPASFSTKQYSILGIHSGGINALTFYNTLQTYMTRLGTQV